MKIKAIKLIAIALIIVSPLFHPSRCPAALGTIAGYVTDGITRKPIEGALIASNLGGEVLSDGQGFYNMAFGEAQQAILSCSKNGYYSQVHETSIEIGETLQIDWELIPATTGPTTTTTVTTTTLPTSTIMITTTTSSSILTDCLFTVEAVPPEGGASYSYFLQGCTPQCRTVTAIPNPGYSFNHWGGDATGSVNPTTVCNNGGGTYLIVYYEKNPTTTTSVVCDPFPSPSCCAEAIYCENAEELELLREYRDNVLSKTPEGQEIIKIYYKLCPTIVVLLERRPELKKRAKMIIDNMLPGIRKKVEESN